ncbi:hypothetical protein PRK78_000105 [Emydomyces testavorans]|uniref:Uncharacterized protein n=1 Tax=Emydomyces testavorans TaxID=2070801 RepID=A0AAF0DAB7_9EURO|nr:hypothetical protein PRK78_000105 [Emydomyces testavorans]
MRISQKSERDEKRMHIQSKNNTRLELEIKPVSGHGSDKIRLKPLTHLTKSLVAKFGLLKRDFSVYIGTARETQTGRRDPHIQGYNSDNLARIQVHILKAVQPAYYRFENMDSLLPPDQIQHTVILREQGRFSATELQRSTQIGAIILRTLYNPV